MRQYLGPVRAAQVQTELGPIFLTPNGTRGVHVNAPHLTVDGVPLQASAFLSGNGQSSDFGLVQQYDSRTGIWSTSPESLQARLVDGSVADIVVLGKLAQVIVPAVRKFAEQNWALFLEAERRSINNEVAGLEAHTERERSKIVEKERMLAAVNELLNRLQ
jgi:hypothetical protein